MVMPLAEPTQRLDLEGCREILREMGNPKHIADAISRLEEAVYQTPNLSFDLAKALLESVCKTILEDRGITVDTDWKLPRLLKQTLTELPLVPDGYAGKAEGILRKIAGSLQTVVASLGELRNKEGIVGHGKSAYFQQLESVQAIFAARSAESVIHLLYMCHIQETRSRTQAALDDQYIKFTQYPQIDPGAVADDQEIELAGAMLQPGEDRGIVLPAGDVRKFNQRVDEENEVAILGATYRASEALYYVDSEAYRVALTSYIGEQSEDEEE